MLAMAVVVVLPIPLCLLLRGALRPGPVLKTPHLPRDGFARNPGSAAGRGGALPDEPDTGAVPALRRIPMNPIRGQCRR